MKSFSKIWIVARGTLSNISLFFKRKREGLGVLLCLLSAATKIFANWKLRNHKPDLNETCLIYVPPQHLSFPKKCGRQWLGGGGGASKNPPKNAQKIHKMSTLTSPKSSLKNAIKAGFFSTVILNHLTLVLIWEEGGGGFNPHTGVLLARIKFYLQICTPTVIKTIPSCFLLNL